MLILQLWSRFWSLLNLLLKILCLSRTEVKVINNAPSSKSPSPFPPCEKQHCPSSEHGAAFVRAHHAAVVLPMPPASFPQLLLYTRLQIPAALWILPVYPTIKLILLCLFPSAVRICAYLSLTNPTVNISCQHAGFVHVEDALRTHIFFQPFYLACKAFLCFFIAFCIRQAFLCVNPARRTQRCRIS